MSAAAKHAPAGAGARITVTAAVKRAWYTVHPVNTDEPTLHLLLEGDVYCARRYPASMSAVYVAARSTHALNRHHPQVTVHAGGWSVDDINRARMVLTDVSLIDCRLPRDHTVAADEQMWLSELRVA